MQYEIKIGELAKAFPTLNNAPLQPWNAETFDSWACEQGGSGLQHAARFVLAVWAIDATWRIGRFDAMNALAAWDETHRKAFAAWCSSPWWR